MRSRLDAIDGMLFLQNNKTMEGILLLFAVVRHRDLVVDSCRGAFEFPDL